MTTEQRASRYDGLTVTFDWDDRDVPTVGTIVRLLPGGEQVVVQWENELHVEYLDELVVRQDANR